MRREKMRHPQIISNLVNYDGYHLILVTENKPFTPLSAFTSGMGLAYIDDDLKLIEPFGFNRLKGKIFVGICLEDWDEFQKDINSCSSRYFSQRDLFRCCSTVLRICDPDQYMIRFLMC